MPTYGSNGQFGGSPYNNPQMGWGTGGGGGQTSYPQATPHGGNFGAGWFNQGSPMEQWENQWAPDAAAWNNGTPGRLGQTLTWNPQTQQWAYVNSTEGLRAGDKNIWYIDPVTGMKTIDPKAMGSLMGQFGAMTQSGGGGGYQGFTPSDYQGGTVTPGAGYGGFDYDTIGSGIDPGAVIAAQEYKLQEAMQGDFAKAGGRMGQSGFAMSTPYANALGEASRKAAQDRNAITLQYQYDAAQAQAARDLQQQLQAAQLDFGGWQTGYQGDLQAQMFNQGQDFDAWLAQQQMGMQNNQSMNEYNLYNNQANQSAQAALMAAILGGMF